MPSFCGIRLLQAAQEGFQGRCGTCLDLELPKPGTPMLYGHGWCLARERTLVQLHDACGKHRPGPLPERLTTGNTMYFGRD